MIYFKRFLFLIFVSLVYMIWLILMIITLCLSLIIFCIIFICTGDSINPFVFINDWYFDKIANIGNKYFDDIFKEEE